MFKSLSLLLLCFSFVLSAQNSDNDTDNDLVPNKIDKCPNTPEGVFVTRDGCTKEIHRTIYFNHASTYINDNFKNIIKETAELIKETPGYKINISGHTDFIADASVNMILSKERAMAVERLLINNHVIKDKVTLKWYGETMPVATNITDVGRAKNSRVNITLY